MTTNDSYTFVYEFEQAIMDAEDSTLSIEELLPFLNNTNPEVRKNAVLNPNLSYDLAKKIAEMEPDNRVLLSLISSGTADLNLILFVVKDRLQSSYEAELPYESSTLEELAQKMSLKSYDLTSALFKNPDFKADVFNRMLRSISFPNYVLNDLLTLDTVTEDNLRFFFDLNHPLINDAIVKNPNTPIDMLLALIATGGNIGKQASKNLRVPIKYTALMHLNQLSSYTSSYYEQLQQCVNAELRSISDELDDFIAMPLDFKLKFLSTFELKKENHGT